MLLTSPSLTDSSRVQSSAYLCVLTASELGIESSTSFTYTLKSVGEMTEPVEHQQGMAIRLTRRSLVLPVDSGHLKNFESIARGFLLILSSASFLRSIPWSTMSKAFLKSKKKGMDPHAAVRRVVNCVKPILRDTGEGGYSGSILYKGVLIVSDFQVLHM